MTGAANRSIVALAALIFFVPLWSTDVKAAVIITAVEIGGDVVFSRSGSLDISGLSFLENFPTDGGQINPYSGNVVLGAASLTTVDVYTGVLTSPTFGTSMRMFASIGTGDVFGAAGSTLGLPTSYTSSGTLSGSSTYANETFASLGITTGSYVWSWASDSITLNVSTVPIPASVWLFGSALGLLGWMRRKKA